MKNQVICGDSIEVLRGMPENSVDSIVTDPPYELGFMGKEWDNTGIAYNVELWSECLRVLKPGGHLLAFSGTRTYHRMAVAIEDAGFEVRDMLEWIYACCSEDTEILTKNGWEHLHISKGASIFDGKEILVYDSESDIYKWEKPERWNVYNIQQDTLCRIKSDNTDQLVTRNHRCLVEREGELVFIQAKECSEMEFMPYLSDDFHFIPKVQRSSLLQLLQWESPLKGINRKGKNQPREVDRGTEAKSKGRNDGSEKQGLERRIDLLQEKGQVCRPINKVCSLPTRVYQYVKERWLCNGTQVESSNRNRQTIDKGRKCSSYQSRCNGQQDREFNAIQNEWGTQKVRTRTSYKTTLATIEPVEYSGIVFCPTTSTGAFVARRNGKIFITGNSGFPKSQNIGKMYDKMQGNEREVVGEKGLHKYIPKGMQHTVNYRSQDFEKANQLTKGTSPYEGLGSALKPAHEPICMARKPLSEKTIVDNVVKWGTGAIDIDGCRIPTQDSWSRAEQYTNAAEGYQRPNKSAYTHKTEAESSPLGRFPANILCGNDALNDGVITKSPSGQVKRQPRKSNVFNGENCGFKSENLTDAGLGDSGSKSRYFDIDAWGEKNGLLQFPKASKSERGSYNNHPTVKPIHLMSYLIRLVTPKGGIVLDPFGGSGTTACSAIKGGYGYVIIEKEQNHVEIINKRISEYSDKPNQPNLFESLL